MRLTVREERICQQIRDEGHDDLADVMRDGYIRQHQLLAKLKDVDVDTLYGPAVSETMRNAMKTAIANEDSNLVSSLHSLCLSVTETG